ARKSAGGTDDLERHGDPVGRARAENLLGQVARKEKDFAAARDYFTRALEQFRQAGYDVGAANVHNNLGLLEREEAGSQEQAAYHLQEALRLRRKIGDGRGMAETLNNLGLLAYYQQDWEAAWHSY